MKALCVKGRNYSFTLMGSSGGPGSEVRVMKRESWWCPKQCSWMAKGGAGRHVSVGIGGAWEIGVLGQVENAGILLGRLDG